VWLALGLGVFAAIVIATRRQRRLASLGNLGWVSERWLTEYRADQQGDSM